MAPWSSISFSRQWEFIGPTFAPYFVIVSTHVDKLRNMKSHFVLVVAFLIPFFLHLISRDGIVYGMATCRALIGWIWVLLLTRGLWFSCASIF